MEHLVGYFDEYLDEVIIENEPWLKEQISNVADPVFDYLLRESTTLDEEISLTPVLESLEDTMREPFLESPPPSLARSFLFLSSAIFSSTVIATTCVGCE